MSEGPAYVGTGELTADMIYAAIDKLRNATYTVCVGSNQHVVHPLEYERGGWATCANCFQMVQILKD